MTIDNVATTLNCNYYYTTSLLLVSSWLSSVHCMLVLHAPVRCCCYSLVVAIGKA